MLLSALYKLIVGGTGGGAGSGDCLWPWKGGWGL